MRHPTASRRRSVKSPAFSKAHPRLELLEDRTLLDTTGMLRWLNPDYLMGPIRWRDPGLPSEPGGQLPPPQLQDQPPNILVNDPAEDGRSINDTHSETTLVIGADNAIIAGFNDSFTAPVGKYTGYSVSTNGGESFVDKRSLPTNPNGDAGDPVLARDAVSGRIYFATLSFNFNEVHVFRSDDNGATFKAPVNVFKGGSFLDKEWMAVDNFDGPGQGNVYLVVRDFGGGNGIYLFRSDNGGDTWTPSGGRLVIGAGNGNVQGAWVTVGPDHAVYASWFDQSQGIGNPAFIRMKKSTDQGQTFGPTVTIANLRTRGVNGDLGLGGFRSSAFAQMVVNPVNGNLYVAYPDQPPSGPGRANIFFTQSTDGGAHWSAAVKINDDATTRDHWEPALAVTPNGSKVGIFWYDRRNDPANNLIDRYGVIGDVAGDTVVFEPNFRITEVAFPPEFGHDPAIVGNYMGDYDQAQATSSTFYLTWGDNRSPSLGHAGKRPDVRFAVIKAEVAGPSVVSNFPRSDTFGDVSSMRVAFDEEIQVATFTKDKIASFTGPGGPIAVSGVAVVPGSNNRQFDVSFATQHSLGIYSMVIGPNILDVNGRPMDQDGDGTPGEIPVDQFTAKFTIQGPKIIASTPADKLLGPVSSVQVTFNEPVNPATFTKDKIFAFKGPKGFIDVTGVTLVAGSNNTKFDIKFAAQTATGRYEMDIGPDIRDMADHQMDQDGNFKEGEDTDRYFLHFGLQGPRIIASTQGNLGPGLLPSVRVTFNEQMDPATFTTAKIASFVRKVGPIETDLRAALTRVSVVGGTNNTQFDVFFSPQALTGSYRMVIGPDIRDRFGNPMDQDDNLIPGEIPGDQYILNFNLFGPKITFGFPNNAPPIFSVRVGFNEPMDQSTFTRDKVNLTGPNGAIPITVVQPVIGTNFTQFDIVFPPSTATGRYSLIIGPDIRDLFGNQMDQDDNFIPGEIPQDQFTVRFTAPGPKVVSAAPSGNVDAPVDHVRVVFDTLMDRSTFTPDKVVLTGPDGDPIDVTGIAVVPFTNNTFDVSFAAQGPKGTYKMVIGPDIRDVYGNPMDQDGNFVPGEIPGDQFTVRFVLQGPKVTATSPSGNLLPPVDHLRVSFNESMDPTSFTPDQITSFTGPNGSIDIAAVVPVAGQDNKQFDVTFDPQGLKGPYVMVIGPVSDPFGNETAPFTARFTILGPQITASSPTGSRLPPVDHVRLTFNEPMDASQFTPDQITSFTGPNGSIDIAAVVPVAGQGNKQFDVTFATQGPKGNYVMVVGPVADLFGNETARFTARFTLLGPVLMSSSPSGNILPPVDHVRLTFNEPMDASQFTPDRITSFTGPKGPIDIAAVVPVAGQGNKQFDVTFAAQGPKGNYVMVVGPVADPYGNVTAPFTARFTLLGPLLTGSSPTGSLLPPVDHLRLTFNEAMDASKFTPDRITSFTGPAGKITVDAVMPVTGQGNKVFDVSFAAQGPKGNYVMVVGPVADPYGNATAPFTARFTLLGPTLTGSSPTGQLLPPVDHVRLTFNEPMDPSKFTTDQVTSFTGPAGSITVDAVQPVPGLNNTQFDVTFAAQGLKGNYVMVIGPVADPFGNQTATFTAKFAILGPRITGSSPSGNLFPPVDHVRVNFNEPISPARFTRDNITSFTGPDGDITVAAVTPVPGTNNTVYDVTFAAQGPKGSYTMAIGPISDAFGNETDPFTAQFTLLGPKITASSPTGNVQPPVDHVRVTFNEPISPSRFTPDQISSFTGPNGDIAVDAVAPVPGQNNKQYDITFAAQGATGFYTLVVGPVADAFGNQSDPFTAGFGLLGTRIVSSSPARAKPGVDHVRVTFSRPMDVSTFTPDKVASFKGPGGRDITVTDVAAVLGTNNTQFDILFDRQDELGNYTMVIGPDIRDLFGNQMDQDNNLIPGEVPGDQYTHRIAITARGEVVVGYFTDNNPDSRGPDASIRQAQFTPIFVSNIRTFDLSRVDVLLVDESNNFGLSTDLQNRLADIQLWVQGGGIFMVHDRSTSSSFLVGAPGVVIVRDFQFGAFLNVIPPGGTLVTDGPFGHIDDNTLSGGNLSNHGYAQRDTLPGGTVSILSAGPDYTHVAAFSYTFGAGLVYYSTIPLDFYLDGFGDPRLVDAFKKIYTPNVLVYLVTPGMSPIAPPGRPGSGEGVALLSTGEPAVAALGMSSAASLGESSASIGNGATTWQARVSTVLEIRNIDRFFGSTGKEDEDPVFALSRSEHVGLALAGRWKDDAVTDIFGKDSVPF